jgi:hypothetical protein
MIIELNNIKEVEITAKTEFKYYLLFSYNTNSNDPNFRYFLIDQNPDIDWIKNRMDNWNLATGEEFRVFAVMLPS